MTVDGHYTKLNVERYGGSILSPWFDRPLSIAGRVILKTEQGMKSQLINLDRDLAMIANLAIHMNREINNGYPYHVQTDLLPIIGSGDKDFSVPELIAKETGIPASDILSFDLCLYNRMDGTFWGADKEFISCSKLDDLQCAFASVKALSEPATRIFYLPQ